MRRTTSELRAELERLEQYLLDKFAHSDYHGVEDAASDLRDLRAVLDDRSDCGGRDWSKR